MRSFASPAFGAIALILLLLSGPTLRAAEFVNFAVRTLMDPGSEGPETPRPYITAGSRKIAFRTPQNCQFSATAAGMTLFLSQPELSGQITIENSPIGSHKDFLTEIDTYHHAATATLPKEAENLEFLGAKNNFYTGQQWKSEIFEWTYSSFAHPTYRQVGYINLDDEHQIQVTIVADKTSQKAITAFAKRFLSSWYFYGDR